MNLKRLKENLRELTNIMNKQYTEKQNAIVKYELENLKQLNIDLIEVNKAIISAYSRFGEMPTSITMLNQDDFIEVEDLCIEIKNRLEYTKSYLYDLISDINDYYKPHDYKAHKEAMTSEGIDNELRKYVADNIAEVEVCPSGINNEVEHGYIKNKDLDDLQDSISRPIAPIKNFKSI